MKHFLSLLLQDFYTVSEQKNHPFPTRSCHLKKEQTVTLQWFHTCLQDKVQISYKDNKGLYFLASTRLLHSPQSSHQHHDLPDSCPVCSPGWFTLSSLVSQLSLPAMSVPSFLPICHFSDYAQVTATTKHFLTKHPSLNSFGQSS